MCICLFTRLFSFFEVLIVLVCVCAGMGVVSVGPMVNMQATATIAKELLKSGNSPTAEAMVKQSLPATPQGSLQASLIHLFLKQLFLKRTG